MGSRKLLLKVTGIFIICHFSLNLFSQTTEDLQREFIDDNRFGAFIHFGIRTFTGGAWSEPNQDVNAFNPIDLDCGQWANAFVSANIGYGILTTKHHDGFCLWDSKYTENDVASSPWKNGKGDVVREYVDSFRAKGLEPALYYSIWDNTDGIGNGAIIQSDMDYIKGQMTELLTQYGTIKLLFIDGWSWKMGHKSVSYQEIDSLIKALQPGCLLVDNTHLLNLYHNDLLHVEAGGTCPADNTYPALLSQLIYTEGGNSWFWDDRIPIANLKSVNQILSDLEYVEPRWCSYILNCPPNNKGLIDDNIVNRLKEVGQSWLPDPNRPDLPDQGPQNEHTITPVSATATSGNASYAIDGLNDRFYYSVWQSSASLPQSVTIDLGKIYNDVSFLSYVPKYIPVVVPKLEGCVTLYKIYVSVDDVNFIEVKNGTWEANIKLKVAVFNKIPARYVKFEALDAYDGFAAATEISIGRNYNGSIVNNIQLQKKFQNAYFEIFPNPFNDLIYLRYSLTEPGYIEFSIYDILGRKIKCLNKNTSISGEQEIIWDGKSENGKILLPGVYFCNLVFTSNSGEIVVFGKEMVKN